MKSIIVEYKGTKQVFETHGKMTFKEWITTNMRSFLVDPNVCVRVKRVYGPGTNTWGYPEKDWGKAPMDDSTCNAYLVQIVLKRPENSPQEETPAMSTSKKPEQHLHMIYGVDILAASKPELMTLAAAICDSVESLQRTAARIPSTYVTKQLETEQALLAKVVAKLDE